MKLKSGHEVVSSTEEEKEEMKKLFPGSVNGYITLKPGGWFLMPSFVNFADRYHDFKFQPSDVVILTYPKCGTTWTQEIVWTMIHNPNFDNPLEQLPLNVRSPFFEMDFMLQDQGPPPDSSDMKEKMMKVFNKLCPGRDPANGVFLQLSECTAEPRVIKTHLAFSLMAPNMLKTCKVIYVARNPKDVLFSYLHHVRSVTSKGFLGDESDFLEVFLDDKVLHSPFWGNLNEAWMKRANKNLHWIFYEEMKADPIKEMKRLNEFLGSNLPISKLQEIVDYTKFDTMKKRDPMKLSQILGQSETNSQASSGEVNFFRKGKAGSWKESITKEQNDKLDAWISKNNVHGIPFTYT